MNQQEIAKTVESKIRNIPDFPKKGILFKDITTAIGDARTLALIADWFAEKLKDKKIDYVVGLEARGFIFAPIVAYKIGAGFVPVRKPGKLPYHTEKASYDLEYGSDSVEIHKDAFEKGARIAVIDDLLATGGTAKAACELIEKIGGKIEAIYFLIELADLKGRDNLPKDTSAISLIVV